MVLSIETFKFSFGKFELQKSHYSIPNTQYQKRRMSGRTNPQKGQKQNQVNQTKHANEGQNSANKIKN